MKLLKPWAGALLVGVTALAASATGLSNGFAYDDLPIIAENPAVHDLRAPTAYFGETYWGPTRGQLALYRPLSILAYSVQWNIGGGSPLPFHIVNVVLYVGVALVAFAFLRYLLPPLGALLAGLVFAAHPVHVESVANVVGQAELWVALAVFGALTLYARARERGPLDVRSGAIIGALYFVSLFVKEHGIVLPALILGLEWLGQRIGFARTDGDWRRVRILALSLVALAAAYLACRVSVLGVLTGDAPVWGLRDLSAPQRWTVTLALLPEYARLMFWPARLYADYSPQQVPILPHLTVAHIPGALLLLATIAVFIAALKRAPRFAFGIGWFATTLLLVSSALFPVGVLIAERTLFLPTFAAALAIGAAVAWLAPVPGVRRSAILATVGAVIGLATVHSAQRQRVWADNATLFSTFVVEAPQNFRAHFALGEFYALAGFAAQADSSFVRAFELYPTHLPARVTYAQFLQLQGRCREALPILTDVMQRDPGSDVATVGTAICLLDEQRLHEARSHALRGISHGWSPQTLAIIRALADSLMVANDSVDARNRWWREGKPYDRTGRRLRIVVTQQNQRTALWRPTLQGSGPSATVQVP